MTDLESWKKMMQNKTKYSNRESLAYLTEEKYIILYICLYSTKKKASFNVLVASAV